MAARELPTGTVTFLFSDMEGSTRLVQDLGPAVFTETSRMFAGRTLVEAGDESRAHEVHRRADRALAAEAARGPQGR